MCVYLLLRHESCLVTLPLVGKNIQAAMGETLSTAKEMPMLNTVYYCQPLKV